MYALYIMDMAILCAAAIYAARLQIIVNPPFSLFREYVAQLMEYGKDFFLCHTFLLFKLKLINCSNNTDINACWKIPRM